MASFSDRFKDSWYKHPILWNLVTILVSFVLLIVLALFFLDLWTHHGSTTVVPDVLGYDVPAASEMLEDADLEYVIADSVYTRDKRPGSIVDVIPQPGSIVKAGREVYLTIVAYSPEPIIIDILLIDTSAKQAEAYLRAKGLKVEKRYVPSEFADIVVAAKCNGRNLTVGSKVTAADTIILEVGKIEEPKNEIVDPLDILIGASIDESGNSVEENAEVEVEPASSFLND